MSTQKTVACGTQMNVVNIRLGEFFVTKNSNHVAICVAIGSCVAVGLFDPDNTVAGMAHFVLPTGSQDNDARGARFVSTGLPRLVEEMGRLGSEPRRLVAHFAGGAQKFPSRSSPGIGAQNTAAVKLGLKQLGIELAGSHFGGDHSRGVRFECGTGRFIVSLRSGLEVEL